MNLNCNLCAHNCNIDRNHKLGFCKIDDKIYISTICVHKGEEPVIGGEKGICNVFFNHCNLQCSYCQNFQISDNHFDLRKSNLDLESVYSKIAKILDCGINSLGLVSPTPYIPRIYELVNLLHSRKYFPTIVYNTNAYENVKTILDLESIVDIYLPDYKYANNEIAEKYSLISNYPETALAAIKEMYRQKGSKLILDENGIAKQGLIIRHLVLPSNIENSKSVLLNIALEISPKIHISLMSQYYPIFKSNNHPEINRKLTFDEYNTVVNFMDELGLENGWIQELVSAENYLPDFGDDKVFKN
ncbi:radical SAM protein [Bacteroidales bacterium OttesenSCG-928-K03]|nr:radical SAM protein [Bacteroidales bacterium OttesenSCG-928-L14]MDL2240937.1 radical SAM protein [Bacteroidales bacterium OttesenSCG-928-K22]MDL2243064.1 radical SAM protein [Bacteroidales bacterium OttesenSCG-928-K03]